MTNQKRLFGLGIILSVLLWPVVGYAQSAIGSDDWHFEVSKSIAVELADSPSWSLSLGYLRDISVQTQDWNVLLLQAKVELQQGNVDAARAAIDRALALYPDNPRILAMAGNVAADSGQFEQAENYYRRVLDKQPHHAQVLLALARIYYARKDWAQVIAVYESLNRVSEPTSEVWVRMATACEGMGDFERAEDYLKQNLEIHPNRVIALLALERFYGRIGATDKAQNVANERARLQKTENADTRVMRSLPNSSR